MSGREETVYMYHMILKNWRSDGHLSGGLISAMQSTRIALVGKDTPLHLPSWYGVSLAHFISAIFFSMM